MSQEHFSAGIDEGTGLVKSAMARSGAEAAPATRRKTEVEQPLPMSRKRARQLGADVGEEPKISRNITTPVDRNANSKESLAKTQEHLGVLEAHANTHYGAIQTAAKALPEAHSAHGAATRSLGEAHTHLAMATSAFAERNSAKGNGHLKSANNALISALKSLNSKAVREVTGGEVPLHIDELKSWKEHISKLPSFRTKGKPFPEVNIGGVRLRTGSAAVQEIRKAGKGTIIGDKADRAERGTARTPKWQREETGRPTMSEKGTGVVDTTSRGTNAGTTGANDPRRKGSSKETIRMRIAKPNLPKIGDTIRKPKKK